MQQYPHYKHNSVPYAIVASGNIVKIKGHDAECLEHWGSDSDSK